MHHITAYQEYACMVIHMQKTKLFEPFLRYNEESIQEI
jgi:hypothetical protein